MSGQSMQPLKANASALQMCNAHLPLMAPRQKNHDQQVAVQVCQLIPGEFSWDIDYAHGLYLRVTD